MQKFFLHIGTHKTGTSSIQNTMTKLKKALRGENIIYIPFSPEMGTFVVSENVDTSFIEKSKKFLDSYTSSYQGSKDIRYVMSHEGFSGDPRKGYCNAAINAEILSKILEPYDVEVIIYLRQQDSFLESMYTQSIHEGDSLSFDEFMAVCNQYTYNWYGLIDSYANYFGKDHITVRRYDKVYLKNGDVTDDFAELIGSKVMQSLKKKENINRGYSRDALELARICNKAFTDKEKKKLRYLLQVTNSKSRHEKYSYFNNDARVELLNTYADSNTRVAKEYLEDKEEKLFNYDLENLKENDIYTGLTQDGLIQVVMKAVIGLEDESKLVARLLGYGVEGGIVARIKKLIRVKIRS